MSDDNTIAAARKAFAAAEEHENLNRSRSAKNAVVSITALGVGWDEASQR